MDKFVIQGGKRLTGEVEISGAKNAAVGIIAAVALSDGVCRLENLPDISDVQEQVQIFKDLGARVHFIDRHTVEIDPSTICTDVVPYELARQLRASYYFIGSLVGRGNHAIVPLPGGCDFGVRPIDLHLKGFKALGCTYNMYNGRIEISAEKLIGSTIYLDFESVGATMNIMLMAVKAEGLTTIENAAREPHVVDLANFLNLMGADVRGAGTDSIKIYGTPHLHGATYAIIPDQIEAGTYMVAAAATGGDVLVKNVIPKHLESITAKLVEMGVDVEELDDAVRIRRTEPLHRCNVKTMPHPGFPTDMQPQIAVLLCLAEGTSIINESVWSNRYRYVDELKRMGAQISVDGKVAVVEGIKALTAAPVKAVDLRAGAAVVIAALCADGKSTVEDIMHIERGYEDMVKKLQLLGADIYRQTLPEATAFHVG